MEFNIEIHIVLPIYRYSYQIIHNIVCYECLAELWERGIGRQAAFAIIIWKLAERPGLLSSLSLSLSYNGPLAVD
jgi:hypothetical protein